MNFQLNFIISKYKMAYIFHRCPPLCFLKRELSWFFFQKSAQTVLRGCEEHCGSPRVRTMSGSRVPPLLSHLSEISSADECMSDTDSVPCSPLILPCSPQAIYGSLGKSYIITCGNTLLHIINISKNHVHIVNVLFLHLTGVVDHERHYNNNTGENKVRIKRHIKSNNVTLLK